MAIDVHLTPTVDASFDAESGYWSLFDYLLKMQSVEHWRSEHEADMAWRAGEVSWTYI